MNPAGISTSSFPAGTLEDHPPFVDMIEDALGFLGDNSTGQEIKEYIQGHYKLNEDPHQIDVKLKEGFRTACELDEIKRIGGSGNSCRFQLCSKVLDKKRANLKRQDDQSSQGIAFNAKSSDSDSLTHASTEELRGFPMNEHEKFVDPHRENVL